MGANHEHSNNNVFPGLSPVPHLPRLLSQAVLLCSFFLSLSFPLFSLVQFCIIHALYAHTPTTVSQNALFPSSTRHNPLSINFPCPPSSLLHSRKQPLGKTRFEWRLLCRRVRSFFYHSPGRQVFFLTREIQDRDWNRLLRQEMSRERNSSDW